MIQFQRHIFFPGQSISCLKLSQFFASLQQQNLLVIYSAFILPLPLHPSQYSQRASGEADRPATGVGLTCSRPVREFIPFCWSARGISQTAGTGSALHVLATVNPNETPGEDCWVYGKDMFSCLYLCIYLYILYSMYIHIPMLPRLPWVYVPINPS